MIDSKRSSLHVEQFILKDGSHKTFLKARKSDWVHHLVYLDGKPFDFTGRDYLLPIYNSNFQKKLLLCGRQVEKSTMLANEIIVGSAIQPFYKTLYVSPSHSQTRQFSNGKLKPWMTDSPIIAKYLINSETSSQVFEKGLSNGSITFLRSAFLSADRARGISADLLALDELQDLLTSNIPVIEECLSHAKDPKEIMSGTPKTLENPIQQYWELSSMCEWLVPCHAHTPAHYNFLDEKSIGKKGPICNKCGKIINPAQGRWVAFNDKRDIMGFRISQVMVPWMYQSERKWQELVWKRENYGKAQFYNECLGISYDSATKPITRTELMECCSSQYPFHFRPSRWTQGIEIFAGIDWGEGTDGTERNEKGKLKNASYTVLTMGAYLDVNHFHIFYYRRFTGKEALPGNCLPEIIKTLRDFRVRCTGVDWGHGWGVNDRIEEAMGLDRVIRFQHVGNQKERKKYDPVGHKFQLARNEVMTDFFMDIKDHRIVWPAWEQVKDFLCDFEHVYAEYSEYARQMKYDHKPSEPDDAMHSSVYCKEAADNYFNKRR